MQSQTVCLECWGDGYLSRCCNDHLVETQNGKYKCSCCGQFCKLIECHDCEGSGYVSDEDEEQ